MERQDQLRGAQLHATHLSDWKGCSQDPPLPRLHLMVGSRGGGVLQKILAYWRPSEGKQFLFFVSVCLCVAVAC